MPIDNIFVADFETRNNEENLDTNNSSVWLWDICDIKKYEHNTGGTIESFISYISKMTDTVIYFHNLKFDGSFIIDYLLKNQFIHTQSKKLVKNEFTTLITDAGVFYSITICFDSGNKTKKNVVEIRDSSKKIPGKVKDIAKSYELPILKGEIDYNMYRPSDYQATQKEIEYIHNDTEIIARVLKIQYDDGMDRLTTGSDTFHKYKEFAGKYFKYLFPTTTLEIDAYIRNAYRGGVCQVADKFLGKEINTDIVYDVNSMYPYHMAYALLPYGVPEFFKGKYTNDIRKPLYIQRIRIDCKLKERHQPTILLSNIVWGDNAYLKNTDGKLLELTLTNTDLQLLYTHYDIYDIKYIDGYKFLGSTKLFKSFIKPLYDKKCNTKGSEKQKYKLLINALYGKFATNPKHIQKIPYIDNNIVAYRNSDVSYDKPAYTAVSAFITAYARQQLFTAIQANYDNFIYCDTDSIHLTTQGKGIEVDSKKLGAWKEETRGNPVVLAKYIAQKSYIQKFTDGSISVKLAGCPDNVKELINFDNFNIGSTFPGKLRPVRVSGGIVLASTTFTIKNRLK